MLEVLYLVFSEGYTPSVGEESIDPGLCRDALRFSRLFTDRRDIATPDAFALRALLCFHAARAAARIADAGTDWKEIASLYDVLRELAPSLVVDLNRALAVAMHAGAQRGLDELDAIPERDVVARYPYALAAYAELHASLGNLDAARSYLDRAIACQSSAAQVALLRRKRRALDR